MLIDNTEDFVETNSTSKSDGYSFDCIDYDRLSFQAQVEMMDAVSLYISNWDDDDIFNDY